MIKSVSDTFPWSTSNRVSSVCNKAAKAVRAPRAPSPRVKSADVKAKLSKNINISKKSPGERGSFIYMMQMTLLSSLQAQCDKLDDESERESKEGAVDC